jgi:RNA polymerase sigma-70 factor (ECF subfamily)
MPEFEEIYGLYSPPIFRVCLGYLGDPEQAKDITQETFISVWQNLSKFRNDSKISTWIYRIATNHCLRAVEKRNRSIPMDLPENSIPVQEESMNEKLNFLYTAISELEEFDRLIISWVLEDIPQWEIAEIIGINPGNLRVRIHRIKEKLAQKFRKYGSFE